MSSALDEVLDNKQAQEFWLRRFVAVLIDYLIIGIPISAMATIAWSMGFTGQVSWLISGTLVVAYSALFESELGYTIGKRVMGLEVVSLDPRPYDMQRALMRNITKIHPVILFFDLIMGILEKDRVNMRYLDTVVATETVDGQVAEWRRAHGFAPPVGGDEAPSVTVQSEGAAGEPTMPPEPSGGAPEEPAVPEPPAEDELVEVEPEVEPAEEGAPGIAPPPIPEEGPEEDGVLEEVSMEEIMGEGPEEDQPAYRMPPPEGKGKKK